MTGAEPSLSRRLVDPELAPLLADMPAFHQVSARTLADLRRQVEAGAQAQLKAADAAGVSVQIHRAPGGGESGVRIVLYRPEAARSPTPALLHVHGGGMVMGRPEMRHVSLLAIARDLGCVIASVDYRLAPETPFPGALEDCYAVLRWLHDEAGRLGVDPARIAVAGESAGGGLAASLAILARDRGEVGVIMQMLTYPMLDDRTGAGAPACAFAGEFVWGPDANRFAWSALLGHEPGADLTPPLAAPARCERLEGLPPAFIAVGALDLFRDECLEYARRLTRAGAPTELHLYPGAFHGFDASATAAVAQAYRADWRGALRRAFLGPGAGGSAPPGSA
jgi:acetyl esterase/lipase